MVIVKDWCAFARTIPFLVGVTRFKNLSLFAKIANELIFITKLLDKIIFQW